MKKIMQYVLENQRLKIYNLANLDQLKNMFLKWNDGNLADST